MERLARLSRENLNACIEIGLIRYFHREPKFRIENFFAVTTNGIRKILYHKHY